MTRRARIALAAAVAIVLLAVLAIVVVRQRPRRHRVFPGEAPAGTAAKGIPPVALWSDHFATLAATRAWDDLDGLLGAIEQRHPDLYGRWSLGYLHARALIEDDEPSEAAPRLAPFLREGNPLRELALYHQAEIAELRDDVAAASRARQALIASAPGSIHREEAIDEEIAHLAAQSQPQALVAFASAIRPKADTRLRRLLDAHIAEALLRSGDNQAAYEKALEILRGGTRDDAADRAARILDRPEFLRRMPREQKIVLGGALQDHRRFDRAIPVMQLAMAGAPHDDELLFALGRCFFGAERFAEAQQTYVTGANRARDARWKATFLYHASRAAQLRGDDAGAERFMTAAVAVKGTFPATTAALTQRIRTRAKQKRFADAAADLQLLRKIAPNDRAVVDGSLAYAIARSGRERIAVLDAVPAKLFDPYDRAEFAYWRARALEEIDRSAAIREYLRVLSAPASHFAWFARERVASAPNAAALREELARRDREIARLVASKDFATAKEVATGRVLLSGTDRPAGLRQLEHIYREIPGYRAILELAPEPLPRFPLAKFDRGDLLMAMGLYDEAVDDIRQRHGLRPARSALTRAVALNRSGASRESIHAIEVLMRSVPNDFVPDLLPPAIRRLLYPRYFFEFIVEDARRHEVDPLLVLSIMREESRFDPRAKSEAAARGLLQFIITTARDIGREIGLVDVAPDDLYDPRVIIHLGAKYVADLSERFDGNPYKIVAAYNAGPSQVALWERLAPAPGNDAFLSAINFDETKHYVRKVMNSHRAYRDVYGME